MIYGGAYAREAYAGIVQQATATVAVVEIAKLPTVLLTLPSTSFTVLSSAPQDPIILM